MLSSARKPDLFYAFSNVTLGIDVQPAAAP